MSLAILITNISILAWILPIFRQYNSKMFLFFLILGLSDPINIASIYFFDAQPGLVHSIAAYLLFYALNLVDKNIKKFSYTDLLLLLLFISLLYFIPQLFFLTTVIHILILVRLIQIVLIPLHKNSILNLFYLVFVFYEITIVVKLIVYLSGSYTGLLFSYITLGFEIIIAIFFTIFKENNPHLTYKLKDY